jgi:hypothetical protein
MLKIVFLLLLICSANTSARMYQWIDPDSGSTQLSGSPPMWYRSVEGGPRVFVFDKSKVVDDTGIDVSDEKRDQLRQHAFLRAAEDKAGAREKLLKAKNLNATLLQKKKMEDAAQEKEQPVEEELPPAPQEELPPAPQEELPPVIVEEDSTQKQMKEIIDAWEKVKTEKAKGLLGTPAP